MPINQFTAFYPSRPFWAGSKIDFSDQSREGWFHNQMAEEVFSEATSTYTLKVCRDGRIMIRIEALEIEHLPGTHVPIDSTVQSWGEYLDFLNAFYLLLDSSTIELSNFAYFNLHEITNRDAFRVRYEGGKSVGENIATESIASVFQMGRYLVSYNSEIPIEYHNNISNRQVISLDVIKKSANEFAKAIAVPGLVKTLSSFAKSLCEYKIGNYETSIVLSWFITEAALSQLWKKHIDSLNTERTDGQKRINRQRKDFLTGRDFTISMVSNLLELWGALPHSQFQDIDTIRGLRNKIVHCHNFVPGASEAQLAIKTAQDMIERRWGLRFSPSMGYSITML